MSVQKKRGRPSKYSEAAAAEICTRLAAGESLRSICRDAHMPDPHRVREWALDDRAGFSPRYARACELRWQTMAEEVIEIADKQDFVERPDIANAMVQQQRLAVDARKWLLSKMAPRKYGDRVEVAGSPDAPIIRRIELIAVYPRIEPPTIDVEPDNGPDA